MLALSTLAFLAGLTLTVWIHSQYRMSVTIPPVVPRSPAPLITVIVPARNEAQNIRRCVLALFSQTYPNLEILVVDDRSTDATASILEDLASQDPRLRVVAGRPLPEGWAGKPHALAQGAERARGEWLCFLDADTFAAPSLLASTHAAARAHGADMLSILTEQILETFWEKAIMPVVFTALSVGFPPRRVNDPDAPEAIANGQFILIRRSVYEALGGHAALRDSLVEDRDLARRVKRGGYRLLLADGRHLARTRMYTHLGAIWEGWTKNIYLGMAGREGLLTLGAGLTVAAAVGLPAWLAAGAAWLAAGGGMPAALVTLEAALLLAVVLAYRVRVARAFHLAPRTALTFPLGALVFAGMILSSTVRVVSRRGVTWKGRRYRR